jgi:hypothetical protein
VRLRKLVSWNNTGRCCRAASGPLAVIKMAYGAYHARNPRGQQRDKLYRRRGDGVAAVGERVTIKDAGAFLTGVAVTFFSV